MVVAIVFEIGGEGEIEVRVDEVRLVVVDTGVRSGIEDRFECRARWSGTGNRSKSE